MSHGPGPHWPVVLAPGPGLPWDAVQVPAASERTRTATGPVSAGAAASPHSGPGLGPTCFEDLCHSALWLVTLVTPDSEKKGSKQLHWGDQRVQVACLLCQLALLLPPAAAGPLESQAAAQSAAADLRIPP